LNGRDKWNALRDFVLAYFRTHRPLHTNEENEKDDMKEIMMMEMIMIT
jgi:hypothetical protein